MGAPKHGAGRALTRAHRMGIPFPHALGVRVCAVGICYPPPVHHLHEYMIVVI